MVIGWRAWVDASDGVEIYDSAKHSWSDIPSDGIIFIMLYRADGDTEEHLNGYDRRESLRGVDHYFMAPHHSGTVYGSSNDSESVIAARYPGAQIKRGKWIPHDLYRKIAIEANKHVWGRDG